MIRFAAAAALSLALLGGSALAQDQSPTDPAQVAAEQDSMLGMMKMAPGKEMSEADRGYTKSMQAMQQTMMKTEMTGDPSGDFVRMMIPHHQSAIDMVDVLMQQKDIDPEIARMAEKMKKDQQDEIDKMQKWLEAHQK